MDRRVLGILLGLAGVALVVVSALANTIGIGKMGFGWKQILGVAVGAVLAAAGARLLALSSRGSRAS